MKPILNSKFQTFVRLFSGPAIRQDSGQAFSLASHRGFTLVEMLIVILLIGGMVGGGVASYRRLNETKLVEGAARQAEQGIRTAQKNAAAGVKPTSAVWCSNPTDTLASYSIDFRGPGWSKQEYRISAVCSDGNSLLVETRELPQGTRFQWNRTWSFAVLTGKKTASGDVRQWVRNQDNSIRYEIWLTEGGSVSTQRI